MYMRLHGLLAVYYVMGYKGPLAVHNVHGLLAIHKVHGLHSPLAVYY